MKLIVGLGNPGDKYKDTRHNVGFTVIDKLAHEVGSRDVKWETDSKHRSEILKTGDLILVKPQTYMNASGAAVKSLVDYYKLSSKDVWVIHDDMDLPIGKIRIRQGGASAGHHGVNSIITALGSDDFLRFRLGIGAGKEQINGDTDRRMNRSKVIDFVLSRFHQHEAGDMKHLVKHAVEAVRVALFDGTDRAMNRFN
jgi:PTH1 family peptidyl-tRNA hydrolase